MACFGNGSNVIYTITYHKKRGFGNIVGKAEKLMEIISIFSFSHNVFYPIKERNHHMSYMIFIVWKNYCAQFGSVQNFVFGKGLNKCQKIDLKVSAGTN